MSFFDRGKEKKEVKEEVKEEVKSENNEEKGEYPPKRVANMPEGRKLTKLVSFSKVEFNKEYVIGVPDVRQCTQIERIYKAGVDLIHTKGKDLSADRKADKINDILSNATQFCINRDGNIQQVGGSGAAIHPDEIAPGLVSRFHNAIYMGDCVITLLPLAILAEKGSLLARDLIQNESGSWFNHIEGFDKECNLKEWHIEALLRRASIAPEGTSQIATIKQFMHALNEIKADNPAFINFIAKIKTKGTAQRKEFEKIIEPMVTCFGKEALATMNPAEIHQAIRTLEEKTPFSDLLNVSRSTKKQDKEITPARKKMNSLLPQLKTKLSALESHGSTDGRSIEMKDRVAASAPTDPASPNPRRGSR